MINYVMDNCCYIRGIMAAWYSHFIYHGRVNTSLFGCCFNCSGCKLNFREEALNLAIGVSQTTSGTHLPNFCCSENIQRKMCAKGGIKLKGD